MSFKVFPARLSAPLIAGTGPIPMIDGSTPEVQYETRRANGVRPCSLTAFSLAKTRDAAPSQIPWQINSRNKIVFTVESGFTADSFHPTQCSIQRNVQCTIINLQISLSTRCQRDVFRIVFYVKSLEQLA